MVFSNLNSYSKIDSIGVSGRIVVGIKISGAKRVNHFVLSNCPFIFMLFIDGNIISDVKLIACRNTD